MLLIVASGIDIPNTRLRLGESLASIFELLVVLELVWLVWFVVLGLVLLVSEVLV